MAAKLGATFLRCALGPVGYAGGCILASRVPDGLRELGVEGLHGGLRRGIEETAKQVGVGVVDVERLFPMPEISGIVASLSRSQPAAALAWEQHAGQIGGLLQGVAELTVDGRAPDVKLCLERLADKVSRDKPLAVPLRTLAADIGAWQSLIERCADALGDGGDLERAYRQRRMQRGIVAAAAVLGTLAVIAMVMWRVTVRQRIEAVIEAASVDACAIAAADQGVFERASSGQQARIVERRAACDKKHADEELARVAARAREEEARREQIAAQERLDRCDTLARAVDAGRLSPEDEATAGPGAPLLRRVASRRLAPADYGPEPPVMPCTGTPAAPRLEQAFTRAVLAAPVSWANAPDPSATVRAALVKESSSLSERSKLTLARRADDAARSALLSGRPAEIARAARLCALRDALGVGGGAACTGLAGLTPSR